MSFFWVALICGVAIGAYLTLNAFAASKTDNDAIISAYRDLRQEAGRKRKARSAAAAQDSDIPEVS